MMQRGAPGTPDGKAGIRGRGMANESGLPPTRAVAPAKEVAHGELSCFHPSSKGGT